VRLFIDHDVSEIIVQGVLSHYAEVDLVRARDVGLDEADDAELLAWAAEAGRVLVSNDRNTMIQAAISRLQAGQPVAGLALLSQSVAYRTAIEDLAAIALCSQPDEWERTVAFLPLVK
jgi:predicted nuclease of predicted toxin-antitoxin system